MPTWQEVERAGEWFCREVLRCTRTRRAHTGVYGSTDFFGADIMGLSRRGGQIVLVQVTKSDKNAGGKGSTAKRKALETLDGDTIVNPSGVFRRIILFWFSERHPEDGRRTVHGFAVQELVPETLDHLPPEREPGLVDLEHDGRSRRPVDGYVWATWGHPVKIEKDTWYKAPP